MKKAIVTLAVGERFEQIFKVWFYPDWVAYAKKYDFDILVIDRMMDTSDRARKRSPSWQKCILHRDPIFCKYDQVAWVDADVRINVNSPNIFDFSPIDKISGVDAWATPSREEHNLRMSIQYAKWDAQGVKYIKNFTPQEYHGAYGLKCDHDNVINCGVLVYTPDMSKDLFEKVYNNYEEKGDVCWNYEMRPMSYEILQSGLVNWLSPNFNMLWDWLIETRYPFLKTPRFDPKLMKLLPFLNTLDRKADCIKAAFDHTYFLHFASQNQDYRLLPLQSRLKSENIKGI